jgi:energy-coupling factor transport system permease protein
VTAPTEQRSTRQRRPVVVLRPIPRRSPIHDLWAGTKFIALLSFSVLLAVLPGWVPIGLVALVLGAAVWAAHVPRGALPSVPRWMWFVLVIGNLTAVFSGRSPTIDVGTVHVGIGGLLEVLRFTALSFVLLGLAALMSWTTNVAEVPSAIAALGRPLRRWRVPVDEWAVALGLALRAFPMLLNEFRMLYAARRLRPRTQSVTWWRRPHQWAAAAVDVFAAALTVALRRADEMGDAITARGGTGQISSATTHLRPLDWVALAIVSVTCAAALLSELTLVSTT